MTITPGNDGGGLGRPAFGNVKGTSEEDHIRPNLQGVTGSVREIASCTTPTIGEADDNQPQIDDGWGRVWPAIADLQSRGEAHTTWTVDTHIVGEHSLPQGGNNTQSEPDGISRPILQS